MLFHTLEAPGTGLYVSQISVEVEGLDAPRLSAGLADYDCPPSGAAYGVFMAGRIWHVLYRSSSDKSRRRLSIWIGGIRIVSNERIIAYADQELKREFDFLQSSLSSIELDPDRR